MSISEAAISDVPQGHDLAPMTCSRIEARLSAVCLIPASGGLLKPQGVSWISQIVHTNISVPLSVPRLIVRSPPSARARTRMQ